jgi:hypothetical protein
MMARFRTSDIMAGHARSTFTGSLYAQFSEYFDVLLDSEHSSEAEDEFEKLYVSNPGVEAELQEFIDRRKNSITALLGVAGVGKSTTIRKLFGVVAQPAIAKFDENTVIVPFYIDSYNFSQTGDDRNRTVRRIINSQIMAAADLIGKKHKIGYTDDDLAKFIGTHKNQILFDPEIEPGTSPSDRVKWIRKNNAYAAAAEELKFVCANSVVNRIVLVVDDIESTSYEEHLELILGILKLRECLKSTGTIQRSYKVEIIISCRPATFEKISRDHRIDGFTVRSPIYMEKPVGLAEIIKKRFEFAVDEIGAGRVQSTGERPSTAKDLDSWERSFSTLMDIVNTLANQYGDLIVELSNNNLRKSQIETFEILENSRWFETSTPDEGGFDIFESNFRTSDAGIIRSIGLKDHNFFRMQSDAPIGNLFYNYQNPNLDLSVIMALRYFGEKSKMSVYAPIKKGDVFEALAICYDEGPLYHCFDEIIDYMDRAGFIRLEKVYLRRDSAPETFIVPQIRGFTLLKLLKKTSVPLELMRDTTFVSPGATNVTKHGRATGTVMLPGVERFVVVGDMIEGIASAEREILIRVQIARKTEVFREKFGQFSVSARCFEGYEASVKRYFYSNDPKEARIPARVTRRRNSLRDFMRGAGLLQMEPAPY